MKAHARELRREDVLDPKTYERERAKIQARVMQAKSRRRVHLGEHLTFLFENAETLRYQVQEMLRIEQRTTEADVAHELATYGELLGGPGELGCTLLIEIEEEAERAQKLRAWLGLVDHLYLELADGTRVRATYDARQVGEERLSSVQYLRFDCGGSTPVAIGCDMPGLELRADLTSEQREALTEDL